MLTVHRWFEQVDSVTYRRRGASRPCQHIGRWPDCTSGLEWCAGVSTVAESKRWSCRALYRHTALAAADALLTWVTHADVNISWHKLYPTNCMYLIDWHWVVPRTFINSMQVLYWHKRKYTGWNKSTGIAWCLLYGLRNITPSISLL